MRNYCTATAQLKKKSFFFWIVNVVPPTDEMSFRLRLSSCQILCGEHCIPPLPLSLPLSPWLLNFKEVWMPEEFMILFMVVIIFIARITHHTREKMIRTVSFPLWVLGIIRAYWIIHQWIWLKVWHMKISNHHLGFDPIPPPTTRPTPILSKLPSRDAGEMAGRCRMVRRENMQTR